MHQPAITAAQHLIVLTTIIGQPGLDDQNDGSSSQPEADEEEEKSLIFSG